MKVIKLPNYDATILYTKEKYIEDDIAITLEDELIPKGTIDITENGEVDVTKYAKVNVNVDTSKPEQSKSATPTKNTQTILPDDGYVLNKVIVEPIPEEYIVPSGTIDITENGTHDTREYESVDVNVPIPDGYLKPEGTIDITENGEIDIAKYEKANVNVDYKVLARSIANRSITTYSDDEITYVGGYAFNGCTKLTSVDLKSATTIGGYAFTGCSALTDVNLPNAKTVNGNAFQNCTSLKSLTLPKATALNGYLVSGCSSLTELNMPNAASGRGYAIAGSKIEHLYLPNFTTPGSSVFREAKSLKTVDIPLLNRLESFLFMDCSALETITFPKVASVASSAMERCYALTYADLPICKSIAAKGFYNNTALETLILRLTTANCTLASTNALTGTKIASGDGYIYVPASRIDSYKTATNWSTYANQFRAIEDYPEICGE